MPPHKGILNSALRFCGRVDYDLRIQYINLSLISGNQSLQQQQFPYCLTGEVRNLLDAIVRRTGWQGLCKDTWSCADRPELIERLQSAFSFSARARSCTYAGSSIHETLFFSEYRRSLFCIAIAYYQIPQFR